MTAILWQLARKPATWIVAAALAFAGYQYAQARAYQWQASQANARAVEAERDAADADAARAALDGQVKRWQLEAEAAKRKAAIAAIDATALVESARRKYADAVARDPLPTGDCPAILDWLGRHHAATIERASR